MKHYLAGLFQPLENRKYNGRKRSLFLYILSHVMAVGLCLVGAITIDVGFWYILIVYIAGAILYYVTIDRITDNITWSSFWSRFYSAHDSDKNEEERLMKMYSNNPTEENRIAIEKFFKHK